MVANTPGILPKTALVASRAAYYPFTIPTKLNNSATLVGAVNHSLVDSVAGTLVKAGEALQPRGPAKWLFNGISRIGAANAKSAEIAQRNKTVFWDPFSQGTESVGRAIAGPGAYYYLRKAGMEKPTEDAIKAVLQAPLFSFPTVGSAPSGDAPSGGEAEAAAQAQAEAQAQAAAQQAAEGAGQAAA